MFGNALHTWDVGDLPPGFGDVGGWTAAGLQAGIEIAVIARFHTLQGVFVCIGEEFEARGLRIQAEDAERRGALLSRGQVDREPFHRHAAFAGAKIAKPDEPEGEHGGGVRVGRTGDRGPAMLAVPQIGAGERGRQRVFQVGFGADFGHRPLGKLAPQEQAKALPENQAARALAQLRAGAAAQVDEEHLSFAAGEAFHRHGEARVRGLGDGGQAPAPVTRAVPRLQSEARAAHFERVILRGERQVVPRQVRGGRVPGRRRGSSRLGRGSRPDRG